MTAEEDRADFLRAVKEYRGAFEERWDKAIKRAGLVGDPYGEVLALLPEVLSEMRAARNAPLDSRVLRQVARATMSSEERKRWMVGCSVVLAVGVLLAGVAGWSYRDSYLRMRCMEVYGKADVCLAITK